MIDKQEVVHFCGIGGIGMSAIAKFMHCQGYKVQGSDSGRVDGLVLSGITVFDKQEASNLGGVKHFIYSSAIKPNNPEYEYAVLHGLHMWHRSDILGNIMRGMYGIVVGGTHGKTTTTAILAEILATMGVEATSIIGGILQSGGENCVVGNGKYILAEGDESDRSFLKLSKKISIVTNVDEDHMENYDHSRDLLIETFARFINETDEDGLCVLCSDSDLLRERVGPMITHGNVVWYGCYDKGGNICANNVVMGPHGTVFNIDVDGKQHEIRTTMSGMHNVANALAATVVANFIKPDMASTKSALAVFAGVKRRFEIIGKINEAIVIDDYAHHPVEIRATIEAARSKYGSNARIIAVLQPHRYSRVAGMLSEFGSSLEGADIKVVTDIYGALEDKSVYGDLSYLDVVKAVESAGGSEVKAIQCLHAVGDFLISLIGLGDVVIFLNAGDAGDHARKMHARYTSNDIHSLITN